VSPAIVAERPIFVRHDAQALARLVGATHPCCHAVALGYPDASKVLASEDDGNPLHPAWLLDLEVPGERIITWSGTLADDLFGDDPRTWMRAGQDAFRGLCDTAAPTLLRVGKRIAFRPHVRHVLSDVQGCLNFLRHRSGQPFEIAFAPADLLTAAMLPDAEDHLTRSFEALGPLASMLLLHDILPADSDDPTQPPLRAVPLGHGRLPGKLLRELLRRCVPASTPIALLPRAVAEQREWLSGG
jgi:hypothetical protein